MTARRQRPLATVNVFSSDAIDGNPVTVVLDAEGLSTDDMAAFARWTNLSETTFVLPPTHPDADYQLRIFTPAEELPFAGHPTLGSAHAWLEAGGRPRGSDVVQQCGAGLVTVRRGERLAFAGPPLLREGPVSDEIRAQLLRGLRLTEADIVDVAWIDNGPGWVGVVLRDAAAVLAVTPDWSALRGLEVGLLGWYGDAEAAQLGALVEVRAFCPSLGATEDPVTGSLNASFAHWLGSRLPSSYVASQGARVGRRGRVHVSRDADGVVWVGGDTISTVIGHVTL